MGLDFIPKLTYNSRIWPILISSAGGGTTATGAEQAPKPDPVAAPTENVS